MASLRDSTSRASALLLAAAAAGVLLVGLAGCTTTTDAAPTAEPTASATAAPTPTAAPDPVLVPTGDATANLPYFDFVNRALLATVATPNGQQIVENLVAAGFVKGDMEITPDTTVGKEAAGSIQFSVRVNGSCLIAQTGEAGYNALAAPLLGTGKCLVGTTRTIDF
jgi:hypothetical protein